MVVYIEMRCALLPACHIYFCVTSSTVDGKIDTPATKEIYAAGCKQETRDTWSKSNLMWIPGGNMRNDVAHIASIYAGGHWLIQKKHNACLLWYNWRNLFHCSASHLCSIVLHFISVPLFCYASLFCCSTMHLCSIVPLFTSDCLLSVCCSAIHLCSIVLLFISVPLFCCASLFHCSAIHLWLLPFSKRCWSLFRCFSSGRLWRASLEVALYKFDITIKKLHVYHVCKQCNLHIVFEIHNTFRAYVSRLQLTMQVA